MPEDWPGTGLPRAAQVWSICSRRLFLRSRNSLRRDSISVDTCSEDDT